MGNGKEGRDRKGKEEKWRVEVRGSISSKDSRGGVWRYWVTQKAIRGRGEKHASTLRQETWKCPEMRLWKAALFDACTCTVPVPVQIHRVTRPRRTTNRQSTVQGRACVHGAPHTGARHGVLAARREHQKDAHDSFHGLGMATAK